MGKEQTLLRLKETEAQIRALKEAAGREREQILRNTRREALDLLEWGREEAEAKYREILASAEVSVRSENEKILAKGREEAARLAAMGRANVDRAVGLVLEKFKGARHA